MVTAMLAELERADVSELPRGGRGRRLLDEPRMDEVIANKHIPVLISPDNGSRGTRRRGWVGGATPGCDRS
jgi:hypothetical protein